MIQRCWLNLGIAISYPRKVLSTNRALILQAQHSHSRRTLETYGMITFPDRIVQNVLETNYASIFTSLRVGHGFQQGSVKLHFVLIIYRLCCKHWYILNNKTYIRKKMRMKDDRKFLVKWQQNVVATFQI